MLTAIVESVSARFQHNGAERAPHAVLVDDTYTKRIVGLGYKLIAVHREQLAARVKRDLDEFADTWPAMRCGTK